MSKKYYNIWNRYNKGYYNGNEYDYGNSTDYNNNYKKYGWRYNNYYENDNRKSNYYNNKKSDYDKYNYNGVNTKYKEKKCNYRNDDYFEKKFNQEINNEAFEDDTKIIISSCLESNKNENKVNDNDNDNDNNEEVIIFENKNNESTSTNEKTENEEKGLIDEFYNKYMGAYEKKIEIEDMEDFCKEVNEKEVMKGELKYKEEFQKNKTNSGLFNPKDYEIFKVVHGINKKGISTKIIDFSFNKKGIEENNIYLNNPEYFSYFRRGFSLYNLIN